MKHLPFIEEVAWIRARTWLRWALGVPEQQVESDSPVMPVMPLMAESEIGISEHRCDVPELSRTYRVEISPEVSMTIGLKMFLGGLFESAELKQRDGRWVLFESKRVADKILDADLVPIIERHVATIYKIDREWRRGVREYVDKSGTTWRKA